MAPAATFEAPGGMPRRISLGKNVAFIRFACLYPIVKGAAHVHQEQTKTGDTPAPEVPCCKTVIYVKQM